jgi:hypothetical protein
VTVALVHAPLRADYGVPVPLGILSFDRQVVGSSQRYLQEHLKDQGDFAAERSRILSLLTAVGESRAIADRDQR